VDEYKYLGLRVMGRGGWRKARQEMIMRARRNFWRVWGLGLGGGELSAGGAASLWETIVRPVLEYGAEVDEGEWEEAERLQRMDGRMCLGVGREVADEAVQGELGWWTMKGRRRLLRLVYWAKMVREGWDSEQDV
jgi:hypothetical protein